MVLGESVQELGVVPARKIKGASNKRVASPIERSLPRGDVVIFPGFLAEEPLDGVSTVVYNENYRGQLVGD